jgi:hypothetical protein
MNEVPTIYVIEVEGDGHFYPVDFSCALSTIAHTLKYSPLIRGKNARVSEFMRGPIIDMTKVGDGMSEPRAEMEERVSSDAWIFYRENE